METHTMGEVVVSAFLENLEDLYLVKSGQLPQANIRRLEVDDAVVDTGATLLSIPRRLINQLGISERRKRTARTAAGVREFRIFEPVRLTVDGRDCIVEVSELSDDCPVLIGQIPLDVLDFIVDPVGQRLIGNPDHGGDQMIELF